MSDASDNQALPIIDPEIMELAGAMPIASPAVIQPVQPTGSLILGLIAGICAAFAVGFVWAIVVAVTNFVFVYSAVIIGIVIGTAVRRFGKGTTPIFGVIGGVLSLITVVVGNLFMVTIVVANQKGIPFFPLFMRVVRNPTTLAALI